MLANTIREILKLTQQLDFISFAGGMPSADAFPTESIREISNEIFEKYKGEFLQYGTSEGFLPLRHFIVEWMAEKGIKTDVSEVVITSGAQQGIDLVAKAFLDPGDRVMIEKPTYLAAIQIFNLYDATFSFMNSDNKGLIPSSFRQIAQDKKHKLAYLVPNFQNPTGITLAAERREELAGLIAESDMVLIEDDPYGDLRYYGEDLPPVKAYDKVNRVVYLGSFSKIISPGLRVGFTVGHKEIIGKVVVGKQASDVHTSNLSQVIIYEFCRQGLLKPHIKSLQVEYKNKRDLMLELLHHHFPPEISWTEPDGGLFIWAHLPDGVSAAELLKEAIKEKIAFIPGDSFFAAGGGTNTMRLNFSNAAKSQMEEGIGRLGNVIKNYLTSTN
jgi:2-aminoadipate transaminase